MSRQKETVACCAKNCPNIGLTPSGTSSPVILHSFPRGGSGRYKLWAGMVGVSPLPAVPKLCSLHFAPDQYKRTGIGHRTLLNEDHSRPKKLKKNSLPSLFYDSDGERFEMVPVTIPEYSDEDSVEDVTLNSCSVGLHPVCTEGQRGTQDSGTFPVESNNVETEENSVDQPHPSSVLNRRGGQQHALVDNDMSKTDTAASGTILAHDFTGERSRVIGNHPGNRRFGKGAHGCNFCGASFSSHLNLGSHLRVHRALPLKCRSCSLQLPNHWKLNLHLKVHGKSFPESNASIATSAVSQELLLETLRLFECKDCGRRFESKFWLAMHAQVHSSSWQKAQERALLRRKELSETETSNQPVTTILQGSLSVLTQSPLFRSREVLMNEILGKTKMSQYFPRSSPQLNSSGYTTTFPDNRLDVSIKNTQPKDYKFSLQGRSLANNSQNAETSDFPPLESRPETLLKICMFDPCHNTKTSDATKMGFVKKVYVRQQNPKVTENKKVQIFESHTDKSMDEGCVESQSSPLTALNKLHVHPPSRSQFPPEARRCSDCGGRFTWPHSLALHRRRRHRRPPSAEHACQCGRSFGSRLGLFRHELRHVRSGCYICCLCGVSFKKSARLVSHWQRHRENGPLLTCTCGLTFKRVGGLVWHLLRNKP
ncbi:zinc finger protein 616 [Anguilla rostrata]|uniref:zinc finger protein 616 n=1 Tax=Anguilla rostrata TaxID=7938 RepID=UPI0030D4FAB2